jgi:Family of unknown function (DUF6455)
VRGRSRRVSAGIFRNLPFYESTVATITSPPQGPKRHHSPRACSRFASRLQSLCNATNCRSIFRRANKGVAIVAAPAIPEHLPIYICEMMERLGIERGGGVVPRLSLNYATALRRCDACPAKQACRDWLDSLPTSVPLPAGFCPNADIFFELQVDQPGPSHPVAKNSARK